MGATSLTTEDTERQEVVDDLSKETIVQPPQLEVVDMAKLAALKAKSQSKQEDKMSAKIIANKERSLEFGVIGTGHAGAKLAVCMSNLGYPTVVINTAMQDLKKLDLPDSSKLLLDGGIGGAAKDLNIGHQAALSYKDEILQLFNDKLSSSQVNVLCTSLGGGSGAGSCEVIIDILSSLEKPIVVIAVLPMDSDDAQTKANSLETLAKLANFTKSKKIANLIVVDNAKIESIFSDVNQMEFYDIANKAIVNVLDVFNTYSMMSSAVKALDSMEFSKILLDGEGLSVYGELSVKNYTDDTAIAEAIINNLDENLLSGSFNLKDTKYCGFLIAASKAVWAQIPASSINYASALIAEAAGTPSGVFKGIYEIDTDEDCVKVYSFFSGLGLPTGRVDALKKETVELQSKVKTKDDQRNLTLQLNTGNNETVSAAQKIKDKIASKSSTFGKFVGGSVDRRKK